jgi:hypothetical protein
MVAADGDRPGLLRARQRAPIGGLEHGPAATAPAACRLCPAGVPGRLPARRPAGTAVATTASTLAPTTTTPRVTAAERAWPAGVAKLRQRLDRVFFQPRVVLTQAKLREYIRTGRSCAPGLARLGRPTERLEQAAATAVRACRNYARAAAVYEQRVAPRLGTGASDMQQRLQAAAEHEGNGSNGLRQAEMEAKIALQG